MIVFLKTWKYRWTKEIKDSSPSRPLPRSPWTECFNSSVSLLRSLGAIVVQGLWFAAPLTRSAFSSPYINNSTVTPAGKKAWLSPVLEGVGLPCPPSSCSCLWWGRSSQAQFLLQVPALWVGSLSSKTPRAWHVKGTSFHLLVAVWLVQPPFLPPPAVPSITPLQWHHPWVSVILNNNVKLKKSPLA